MCVCFKGRVVATVGSLCHNPGTLFFLLRPADPPCAAGREVGHWYTEVLFGCWGRWEPHNAARASFHEGNWSLHGVSKAPKGGLAMGGYPEEQGFGLGGRCGQLDLDLLHGWLRKTLV